MSDRGVLVRRRVRPRSRRSRLRRAAAKRWQTARSSTRVRWSVIGLGALVLAGAAWIVITGLLARSQLSALQDRLTVVKVLIAQGRVSEAEKAAEPIPDMADRAERLTSGPAWWVAANVPYFGAPLEVTRAATEATATLSTGALPALVDVASQVDPAALRVNGHTIRVQPLVKALPALRKASAVIDRASKQVDDLPTDTWLGAVNDRRTVLQEQFRSIRGYVDAAQRAAEVLPTLLGADGRTTRIFIGLQNEAELRGTGGLPGAFAIARVRNGTITFERFESDSALLPAKTGQRIATGLDFGDSYESLYSTGDPTTLFINSNLSPQFPYAARIWAAMWQKQTGQRIDAAIALDPTALSYFLQATGPAMLPGGGVISADNVVSLTQRDNYTLFPDNTQRKEFLVSVLKAASKKLTSGSGAAYNLLQAASLATAQQRLLAWSADPSVQQLLEQTSYAGDISARNDRPLSAVILNNVAAGKMDYYLDRSLAYERTGCGASRDVTVTISLTNRTPATGLPTYVTGRLDQAPAGAQVGDSRTLLDYYATGGAQLTSVTLNGTSTTASVTETLGRSVFRMDLELPRGQTQTVVLHLREPAGKGSPQIWNQPGVVPMDVQDYDQHC